MSAEPMYLEPWMRGTHTEVPAVGRAVLHALELALEDVIRSTFGLSDIEVHARPLGLTPLAFHLKHLARSVDRIICYAEGRPLSAEQLKALKSELTGEEPLTLLLAELHASFSNAAERIRALSASASNPASNPASTFDTPRGVGRRQLPTTLGGALIHVADHTQRHAGQVVTTAQVLRRTRGDSLS